MRPFCERSLERSKKEAKDLGPVLGEAEVLPEVVCALVVVVPPGGIILAPVVEDLLFCVAQLEMPDRTAAHIIILTLILMLFVICI